MEEISWRALHFFFPIKSFNFLGFSRGNIIQFKYGCFVLAADFALSTYTPLFLTSQRALFAANLVHLSMASICAYKA